MSGVLSLSVDQLEQRVGATYRQIDYWCRIGLLRVDSYGSGHCREWPADELDVAATIARLVRAGLTLRAAAKAARGEELADGVAVRITGRGRP